MIGGLVPCSFVDYPGLLAAVVFTRGCNLRCPYCHNPGLVDGSAPAATGEDEVLRFLGKRVGLLDGVVVSGGEPTLHAGLGRLVAACRRLGFRVKLDTNGTRPRVLEELLGRGDLDYVALDVKEPWDGYPEVGASREDAAAVERSLRALFASGTDYEVRTTVVFPRHDAGRLDRIASVLGDVARWVLQPYREGVCLAPGCGWRSPSAAELSELAASLRERHGVPCVARGERDRARTQAARPGGDAFGGAGRAA